MFKDFDMLDYPTALLFIRGVRIEVNVPLKEDSLIHFISTRVNKIILKADTLADLKRKRIKGKTFTLFYYTNEGSTNMLIEGISARFYRYSFVRVGIRTDAQHQHQQHVSTDSTGHETLRQHSRAARLERNQQGQAVAGIVYHGQLQADVELLHA